MKDAPFDALIDMSSDYSMIDPRLCRYLCLDVTPFSYELPLCMGIEGACMTKKILTILGWVELEIGIASLGRANLKFWVADCVDSKGTPFILGTNQIKSIFNQVNTEDTSSWPQPWRSMHYRFFTGNWTSSEDMYDSDDYDTDYEEEDSFEALCRFESQRTPSTSCHSLDSWLEKIEYPASSEEVEQDVVPDLVSEENGNPIPAAPVRYTLPRIEEEEWIKANGGGERSVFRNLVQRPEGPAAEAEFPACTTKVPITSPPQCSKLAPYPIMSCRVTPEGETLFNLQWISK